MPPWEEYLSHLYYDPSQPSSYSHPEKLYQAVKKDGKYKIGRGKIKKWLQGQETYTMHRYVRRKFPRGKIIAVGLDYMWDADLMIMDNLAKYNDGYSKVLIMIDIFSRYVWVRPIYRKTAKEVLEAIKSIFDEGRKPQQLRTDQGKEFTAHKVKQFLKAEGVLHIRTYAPLKANYAERVIMTIKNKIFRYLDRKETYRYVDVLQDIVQGYNSTYHRMIKTAPKDINPDNEWQIFSQQYQPKKVVKNQLIQVKKEKPKPKKKKPIFKFKVGDFVRIPYQTSVFTRSYHAKWTGEIFVIASRYLREGVPVFKLKDTGGEAIIGTFYPQELQKVKKDDDQLYKIEKIIRKRKRKGQLEYLIRWKYWPKKFDQWVRASELRDIKDIV